MVSCAGEAIKQTLSLNDLACDPPPYRAHEYKGDGYTMISLSRQKPPLQIKSPGASGLFRLTHCAFRTCLSWSD